MLLVFFSISQVTVPKFNFLKSLNLDLELSQVINKKIKFRLKSESLDFEIFFLGKIVVYSFIIKPMFPVVLNYSN